MNHETLNKKAMSQISKEKIKDLPNSSGVYHFLNQEGQVLYVGKAKNLRNRVRQYFLKELNRGPAIAQMVELAFDIRWIETESEIEAVLLEAELIKKLKPKYNVRLKDDKSFLVIKINKGQKLRVESKKPKAVIPAKSGISKIPDSSLPAGRQVRDDNVYDFPTVELVRFKNVDLSDKNAEYFGPYPAGLLLKKSLKYLRKIFPFRDCSKTKFKIQVKKKRPCIYGDIGVCNSPCTAAISPVEYKRNIKYLKNFLRGKRKEVIADLEKIMKKLSRERKYEEAVIIRNRILALSHLKNVRIGLRDDLYNFNSGIFARIECYDISNIQDEYAVGSMVVFTNGKPDKSEYRKFKIKDSTTPTPLLEKEGMGEVCNNDLARLKQVLERRFKTDWPLPDLIIIDGGEQQLKLAKETIKNCNMKIPTISISKGVKRDKNDFHYSDQIVAKYFQDHPDLKRIAITARDESHRFAINYYRKLHQKGIFE